MRVVQKPQGVMPNGRPVGPRQFALECKQWAEKMVPEAHVAFVQKIALTLLNKVMMKSPVDTGRFRANWMVGIGASDESVVEVEESDAHGTVSPSAMSRGQQKLATLAFGIPVHVSNNLPYAGILENGGYPLKPKGGEGKTVNGFSTQAPQGMLAISIEEVEAFLKRQK